MANQNKVSPSDCDNDQQPEMAMWPPKPEIRMSGTMTDDGKYGFSTTPSAKKLTPATATTTDNGNGNMDVFGADLAISGIVDRYHNHLANLISSSSSSKIPNLALEFRRYLS